MYPGLSSAAGDDHAIDFPSVSRVMTTARARFFGHGDPFHAPVLQHAVRLTAAEAQRGATVHLGVPVRRACGCCGGRGEVWQEWCRACDGSGDRLARRRVRVRLPRHARHGARLRYAWQWRQSVPVHLELHVTVAP